MPADCDFFVNPSGENKTEEEKMLKYNKSLYRMVKDIHDGLPGAAGESDKDKADSFLKCYLMACLAHMLKLKHYAEIGVNNGRSLFSVAAPFVLSGGTAAGVDPHWRGHERGFSGICEAVPVLRGLRELRDKCKGGLDGSEIDIEIDMLHINGQIGDCEDYCALLAGESVLVFSGIDRPGADAAYRNYKAKAGSVLVCEGRGYAILLKSADNETGNRARKLGIELAGAARKIETLEDRPAVSVGVLAYNHEEFVAECLEHIFDQQGYFSLKVRICEDCSQDNTARAIEAMLAGIDPCAVIDAELIRNPDNLGMVQNFKQLVYLLGGGDYFTFCEGDDYWSDRRRIQTHIAFLEENPLFAFSFNAVKLFYQDAGKHGEMRDWEGHEKLRDGPFYTPDIAKINFIGNLGAGFYRARHLKRLNPELFEQTYCGDWMFNIAYSEFGKFGYIRKHMNVYRKHKGGIWHGMEYVEMSSKLLQYINGYNRFTEYRYDYEFQEVRELLTEEIQRVNPFYPAGVTDIIIFDDVFPHPFSGFRHQEYTSLLEAFDSSQIISFTEGHKLLGGDKKQLVREYKSAHPDITHKIRLIPPDSRCCALQSALRSSAAKLFYTIFLQNILLVLDSVESRHIPFVFTLYPGGGFFMNNAASDADLKRVLSSDYFRGVIVTQQNVYDYLLEKKFCRKEQVHFIFGVVTPLENLNRGGDRGGKANKIFFADGKAELDICFAAHKYSESGQDKGYDTFISAAKILCGLHDNIRFHVVGGFDEKVIDVAGIAGRIEFHGTQTQEWLRGFFENIDIILSPNIPHVISPGAFDGFPTASCTDAALSGAAVFCTDELGLNQGRFKDGEEIVIIKPDADYIASCVGYYISRPELLKAIAMAGCRRARGLYSSEAQIAPRVALLRKILEPWRASQNSLRRRPPRIRGCRLRITALNIRTGKNTPESKKERIAALQSKLTLRAGSAGKMAARAARTVKREIIPVMHCFDNNYAIPAAVSFYSMLQHADQAHEYRLYVLHSDITLQNRQKLAKLAADFPNASLEFIDMSNRFGGVWEKIYAGNATHVTKECLYKLIAPSVFPQYDKLVITDVDVVFEGDISPGFFAFDPSDPVYIAGVKHICPAGSFLENFYALYWRRFGKNALEKLEICGGFLVMNLRRLREDNMEKVFLRYLKKHAARFLQPEQDIFNFCLKSENILKLPLNYVVCTYAYDIFGFESDALAEEKLKSEPPDPHYTPEEIGGALRNPVQLHYATGNKPWNGGSGNASASTAKFGKWFAALRQTDFYADYVRMNQTEKYEKIRPAAVWADYREPPGFPVTVSVLCCTYNHERFIRNTLEYIVNQETGYSFEVIVADDASTDGTQKIIKEYMARYPRLFRKCILREKNAGIGQNYYEALQSAEGKYLALCDGDDYWLSPHKLQWQTEFMERNPDYSMCCSSFITHSKKRTRVFDVDAYIKASWRLRQEGYGFEDLLYCRFIASCTVMFRWWLHGRVPEFLKQFYVIDFPLALIHAAFGRIYVINYPPLAQYNRSKKGVFLSKQQSMLDETLKIIREVNQYLNFCFAESVNEYLSVTGSKPKPNLKRRERLKWFYINCVPPFMQKMYVKSKAKRREKRQAAAGPGGSGGPPELSKMQVFLWVAYNEYTPEIIKKIYRKFKK